MVDNEVEADVEEGRRDLEAAGVPAEYPCSLRPAMFTYEPVVSVDELSATGFVRFRRLPHEPVVSVDKLSAIGCPVS